MRLHHGSSQAQTKHTDCIYITSKLILTSLQYTSFPCYLSKWLTISKGIFDHKVVKLWTGWSTICIAVDFLQKLVTCEKRLKKIKSTNQPPKMWIFKIRLNEANWRTAVASFAAPEFTTTCLLTFNDKTICSRSSSGLEKHISNTAIYITQCLSLCNARLLRWRTQRRHRYTAYCVYWTAKKGEKSKKRHHSRVV